MRKRYFFAFYKMPLQNENTSFFFLPKRKFYQRPNIFFPEAKAFLSHPLPTRNTPYRPRRPQRNAAFFSFDGGAPPDPAPLNAQSIFYVRLSDLFSFVQRGKPRFTKEMPLAYFLRSCNFSLQNPLNGVIISLWEKLIY